MSGKVSCILGYDVYAKSVGECTEGIVAGIENGKERAWAACLNPHSYAAAVASPAFRSALRQADWLVPDGAGILLGARVLGFELAERITGYDIFLGVHHLLQRRNGSRVFFLGSTEETLAKIRAQMAVDWPAIDVAGVYSPPFADKFSDSDIESMVSAINAAKPDVVWVGMTAPKQEVFIANVLQRLDTHFVAAIGAVFDFYAGNIKRSHPIFQKLGLEWLPRLLQEPRRLWRRTFVSAPIFLWHIAMARLGLRTNEGSQ